MSGFHPAERFPFVAGLESAFVPILRELQALGDAAFAPAPDSLTTVADGYDETGWLWYGLFGADPGLAAHRARCPATAAAVAAVPGLVNAGFSRFLPGTRLFPHCGELADVLRCHLGLVVPPGDAAIAIGGAVRRWQAGRCLVFDDRLEHEAWNRTEAVRDVLIVTFAASGSEHH